ncbi:MAG TPA: hypothetical protein VGR87_15360 [Candidatus Limnocylindria bacterium]|jgi:hypothetical protein|nr:hypothetical protein [Candidatus Limnocylindria bacterium]
MLDGLRREFPEVQALARRIPNPRVSRVSLTWAVLAAYGAGLLVGAAVTILLSVLFRLVGAAGPAPALQLATVAGTGAALAGAWTIGGRDAIVVYAALFAAERLLVLTGVLRFCVAQISGAPLCSLPSYILGLWPYFLGAGLAYLLVRWLRAADGDRNSTLEASGALALTQSVLGAALAALLLSATTFEGGIAVVLAAVLAGVACGLVLLRRVAPTRQWLTLGVIAVALLGPWILVSVPSFAEVVGVGGGIAIGGLGVLGLFTPLLELGAAALVLYLAAARKVSAEAS